LKKKEYLDPKQIHRIGFSEKYKTILDAIRDAHAGAAILVEPGVYVEPLFLTKPVTLQSMQYIPLSKTLESSSSRNESSRPEIRVSDCNAVTCIADSWKVPICIDGFNIVCNANPITSNALGIKTGSVVIRNSILTSSSGPVVCSEVHQRLPSFLSASASSLQPMQLVIHSSKICDGAAGGILVTHGANLALRHVHVANNAAAGIELRENGTACLENCHFFDNGVQGISCWMSAGKLKAKNCWIHFHLRESGVLVSESEADFESCELYGNTLAGIVVQEKGWVYMRDCILHNNLEGILIQGTRNADKCEVFQNRSHGIFVGLDHKAHAMIIEYHVYCFQLVCKYIH
jgi:hypothetical protein